MPGVQAPSVGAPVATRLVALDAFRGLSIAAMVIVNNPGTWSAVYSPLEHADWNGLTPTDLIFPFFLFIVGMSLTISRQTVDGPVWRILRRAVVLVALGLLLTGFPGFDPNHWRFTGILPRIAVCYLVAALIYRWTVMADGGSVRISAWIVLVITGVVLVGYWFVLTRFDDLTPEGNIGAVIDRRVFGSHLYRGGRWDPEGLLSTVPALATTLIGVLFGLVLRTKRSPARIAGTIGGLGGLLWVAGIIWAQWFPLNKNLWTSSYVLATAGAAALVFAVCVLLIDHLGWRQWAHPLVVFGRNAITLFVVSGLIGKALIVWKLQEPLYKNAFSWMAAPKNASLIYAVVFLLLMYAMCDWLYKKRIFLTV